ncbi:MAG TPA: RDD family protein [Gaiellales bacterium]|nr:RDD family protein [Gaiellales bacterium]
MPESLAPVAVQAGKQPEEQHAGFCPFCGEPYPARAVFCGSCGQRLPVGAAPGAIEPVTAPAVVRAQPPARPAEALRKAGVLRRTAAFLIDVPIIFAAALVYDAVFGDPTGQATAIILYLAAPVYMIAFECSRLEATPGKLALGIHVVNDAGTRIGVGQAIGRTLLSVVNWFIFFVGFWMAGLRDDGRALNDLGSGTWVVRKERVR